MVRFLMSVTCEGYVFFEEGKEYNYVEDLDNPENKDFILVEQPNSPKGKVWNAKIARKHEGIMFEFVE